MTPEEYIQGRFMKIGKAAAFTPELAKMIKSGVPEIKHPYWEKDLDGNEAKSVFHIKKSDQNNYFLNKMDLEVKRAGKNDVVRETFYLNDPKKNVNKEDPEAKKFQPLHTFKKAFSYLIGRPVRIEYQNANGESRKDWEQIDFKNKLADGKFGKRTFNDSYGFDLEKVMSNYSMKDLANPAYKASLIQSLERGNLQKTPFVGNDGKETPLYVSPNILLGTMNTFQQNKETGKKDLVQLADMEKNGWVIKEFSQVVRERVAEISKKNSQTLKPEKVDSVTKTEAQKLPTDGKVGEKVGKKRNVKEKQGDGAVVKEKKERKNKQNIS